MKANEINTGDKLKQYSFLAAIIITGNRQNKTKPKKKKKHQQNVKGKIQSNKPET